MDKWFTDNKSHLIFLKMIEQIFEIVHKKIPAEKNEEPVHKNLDFVISSHLQSMIHEFDGLNDRYKS